jgi:hypothetical protein
MSRERRQVAHRGAEPGWLTSTSLSERSEQCEWSERRRSSFASDDEVGGSHARLRERVKRGKGTGMPERVAC